MQFVPVPAKQIYLYWNAELRIRTQKDVVWIVSAYKHTWSWQWNCTANVVLYLNRKEDRKAVGIY